MAREPLIERLENMLDGYVYWEAGDDYDALCDFLADLRRIAKKKGLNYEAADAEAKAEAE